MISFPKRPALLVFNLVDAINCDGRHAKSFEQAWEIQSQYAKKAFDAYIAHASKLGEMYVELARNAYHPVVAAKTARKVA